MTFLTWIVMKFYNLLNNLMNKKDDNNQDRTLTTIIETTEETESYEVDTDDFNYNEY